jgi:hypothetical protein
MQQLIEFKQALEAGSEIDDPYDTYMMLAFNLDLKRVTGDVTSKQKEHFFRYCDLSAEEVWIYENFDNWSKRHDLDYLIDLAQYRYVVAKIYAKLFSGLRDKPVGILFDEPSHELLRKSI